MTNAASNSLVHHFTKDEAVEYMNLRLDLPLEHGLITKIEYFVNDDVDEYTFKDGFVIRESLRYSV